MISGNCENEYRILFKTISLCVCMCFWKAGRTVFHFFQWFYYRKILFFKLIYYCVKKRIMVFVFQVFINTTIKKKNLGKYTGEMIRRLLYLFIRKRSVIHNRDEKLHFLKACQVEWSIMGFLWSSFLDTEHQSRLYVVVQSHSHIQLYDPMDQQI